MSDSTCRVSYDPGPPTSWENFLADHPRYEEHWPDSDKKRFRWEFGPIFYRGRLDGSARILIVGQDPGSDESLVRRIFIGDAGQRVQGFLTKLGITHSYIMVNTFLYCITGTYSRRRDNTPADEETMQDISMNPIVKDYRDAILDRIVAENQIEAILTFGTAPKQAVKAWAGSANHRVFSPWHPSAHGRDQDDGTKVDVGNSWNPALKELSQIVAPDEGAQPDYSPYDGTIHLAPIPRHDLPFGYPDWVGTLSTMTHRESGGKELCWDYAPGKQD